LVKTRIKAALNNIMKTTEAFQAVGDAVPVRVPYFPLYWR